MPVPDRRRLWRKGAIGDVSRRPWWAPPRTEPQQGPQRCWRQPEPKQRQCGSWNLGSLRGQAGRAGSFARLTFRMRHGKGRLRTTGRPGLVITSRLGPPALCQRRAAGTIGPGGPGQIGPMRLFPRMRLGRVLRWRDIDGVMQPAMPARRHGGSLGDAVIDHPAPLNTEDRIDLATLGAIVAVAELILADELAVTGWSRAGCRRSGRSTR